MLETNEWDVIIAGAGPIGLLAGLFLGREGFRVLLAERLDQPVASSRAIGVSPPSLEILADLGLDRALVASGVPIRDVTVFGKKRVLGKVSFASVPSAYPYMLSVPQRKVEALLAEELAKHPSAVLLRGRDVVGVHGEGAGVRVVLAAADGGRTEAKARFFLDCSGAKSSVRSLLGVEYAGHRYSHAFVMGDFKDASGFGEEARLFFTPDGAVESFPLPDGLRRWIVQTRGFVAEPEPCFIAGRVMSRTGIELDPAEPVWMSPFGVQRYLAAAYRRGSCFLLGDAAHTMSPIGGQGMNTGFADVDLLAPLLAARLRGDGKAGDEAFALWEKRRRRAYTVAANRAWKSMRLGTIRGGFGSLVRNWALWLMLNGPGKARVPIDYAMLTIPYRTRRAAGGSVS